MSLRHLDSLLRPKSVTLVGASNRPKSIGAIVMQNLLHGGFSGPILPLNPNYNSVFGVLSYPTVEELPLVPDLAIICTPPQTVHEFVHQLGEKGVKSILIMSTDLDEYYDDSGQTVRQAVLNLTRKYSMRILGPNCLGIIIPRSGLNACFGHTNVDKGQIAFVSQSDSLGIAVLDWAHSKGIGFSYFISLGDCADIDFADILDYLGGDPYTSSILLYIEDIPNPRKFISAARSASRNKPLVTIKSRAFKDNSEMLTLPDQNKIDPDEIYDGMFRRAGMLRVHDVAELFDAVETMARSKPFRGDRLAILSNGGGPAIMAQDYLASMDGNLAELQEETFNDLQENLEKEFVGNNPIRIIDHAPSDIYSQALETLLKDKNVNAVMVIHVPTAFASSDDIAGAIVSSIGRSRKNVFTVWLGEQYAQQARKMFALAGIPTYETPDKAVQLFMDMIHYRRNQELLMEAPDTIPKEFTPDPKAARTIVRNALAEGRNSLSQSETKEILSVYTIPVVDTRIAENADEAELFAKDLGYPVAVKLLSPDVNSKEDVGGVALDLETPEDLKKAMNSMLKRVEQIQPNANIDGFIVQKMARRPGALELLTGVATEPNFGPVILFGQGGGAGQIIKDQAVGLPPLNMTLAKELIQRTDIYKYLEGSQPDSDLEPIKLTLVQLSQLIIDVPEITTLSINPLLADSNGVLALDTQIEVAPYEGRGESRLAIRPYPEYLEETTYTASGMEILIRPIRPEDESSHRDFMSKLSSEDLRMRFFGYVHEFTHSQLAKLTQIDYDREMAFVATTATDPPETMGVVRTFFDPDNVYSEFAIVVRSDIKEKGIGRMLMDKMIRFCKQRNTRYLTAYTLRENKAMQHLAKKLGFDINPVPDDRETVELKLDLANIE